MNRIPVRLSLAALAVGIFALLIVGCGSSGDGPTGAKKLAFKLTDAGCEPHNATVPAGPISFEVENAGSSKVTELEVLEGETILGEAENLSEGLSGNFSLTLEPGEYTLQCNGGDEEDGTLTVTGGAKAKADPEAEAAVSNHVSTSSRTPTSRLREAAPFVAAVEAGEVEKAKSPLPHARIRADQGRHAQAGAENRRVGGIAVTGSSSNRLGRRVLSRRWGLRPRKLRAKTPDLRATRRRNA